MALTKCHECGAQVSTEAAACPACGAKPKKRRGLGTWLLVGFAGYFVYTCSSVVGKLSDTPARASTTSTPAVATLSAAETARQQEIQNYQAAFALDEKGGRQYLADRLQAHCDQEDRHLNYIKVKQRPAGKGVGLFCVHDLYTKHALSAGKRGPTLGRWVSDNAELLRKNKVTRVGVWGTGDYASGAWFDVN
jgi:hypothetical protein